MACRRWKARPFKLPIMPDLPDARVKRSLTFEQVGLDYMGPISIKTYIGPTLGSLERVIKEVQELNLTPVSQELSTEEEYRFYDARKRIMEEKLAVLVFWKLSTTID
ncbi:unnamed protein product [Onchocerca ochengi]|uniref:39S ribosomal protein L52, mitochondrial n=1 Tax=Onchocerca ochengi TaxID=42157 RepID=A0A182EJU6_ONCOC|nr:unnamed protein product [Onchocerca ochengi]